MLLIDHLIHGQFLQQTGLQVYSQISHSLFFTFYFKNWTKTM